MKRAVRARSIIVGITILLSVCGQASRSAAQDNQARHPYASNKPMAEPVRFELPGIDLLGDAWHSTFTPDGREIYFLAGYPFMEIVMVSRFQGGKWSVPEVAGFSGRYRIETPHVTPDGLHFLFAKPVGLQDREVNLMVMDRTGSGWSEPREIEGPIKSASFSASPSVASNGNLYFFSSREGGYKIFCSKWENGRYSDPQKLDDTVNGQNAVEFCIAPDESFIVFGSFRPGGLGDCDLYISYRKNGSWTEARNLGPKINSSAYDGRPCISPDGKYLFFSSNRSFAGKVREKPMSYSELISELKGPLNGRMNLYQIDIGSIHSGR